MFSPDKKKDLVDKKKASVGVALAVTFLTPLSGHTQENQAMPAVEQALPVDFFNFNRNDWPKFEKLPDKRRSEYIVDFFVKTKFDDTRYEMYTYVSEKIFPLVDDEAAGKILHALQSGNYKKENYYNTTIYIEFLSEYYGKNNPDFNKFCIAEAQNRNPQAVKHLASLDTEESVAVLNKVFNSLDWKDDNDLHSLPVILKKLHETNGEDLLERLRTQSSAAIKDYKASNTEENPTLTEAIKQYHLHVIDFISKNHPDEIVDFIKTSVDEGYPINHKMIESLAQLNSETSRNILLDILENSDKQDYVINVLSILEHHEESDQILSEIMNKYAEQELNLDPEAQLSLNRLLYDSRYNLNVSGAVKAKIRKDAFFADPASFSSYFQNNYTPEIVARVYELYKESEDSGFQYYQLLKDAAVDKKMTFHEFLKSQMEKSTYPVSKEILEEINRLEKLNITNTKTLGKYQEIILKERESKLNDERQVAVIIGSSSNDFFCEEEIDDLIKQGYRVLFYEVDQEQELFNTDISSLTDQEISILLFLGHGSEQNIAIGGEDPAEVIAIENESKYLDTSDMEELKQSKLAERINDSTQFILGGCKNGFESDSKSLKEAIAETFPENNVFASEDKYIFIKMLFDQEKKLKDCTFLNTPGSNKD